MIQRSYFYDEIRRTIFKHINSKQVDGLEFLLDMPCDDDRQFAYLLATTYHETAHTMQPIREIGRGKGKQYGKPDPETGEVYYGRGYVQLTWKRNYQFASDQLGVDFVTNPDRVMEPRWAREILVVGCLEGWFTGKRLGQYITATTTDFVQARRVVNGLDRAKQIAGYARRFHAAIGHTGLEA